MRGGIKEGESKEARFFEGASKEERRVKEWERKRSFVVIIIIRWC